METKNLQYNYKIIHILIFLLSVLVFNSCGENKKQKVAEEKEKPLFQKVPSSKSGIHFRNDVEEKYENYFDVFPYVYNGSGLTVGDINNDGLVDIYFTANENPNKLYLNKGNMTFEDISAKSGATNHPGWQNGAQMIDINGDGFLDIYLCRGGWQDKDADRRNLLFVNNGDLTFTEKAAEYGIDDIGYSIHAAFFDMDNDNDLDLFVMNRPDSFYLTLDKMYTGRYEPNEYNRDKLYRNDNGTYTEIGLEAGIKDNYGYGLGLMVTDLNHDGFDDIFVSNDYAEKDYYYVNQGNGTFKEQVTEYMQHISLASMGSDAADINNDGYEDLFVLEMQPFNIVRSKTSMPPMEMGNFDALLEKGMHKQYLHNVLHLSLGNGYFSEIGNLAGTTNTDWSWSVLAEDYDNDGDRDLFITNGFRRDLMHGDLQERVIKYMNQIKGQYKDPEDFLKNGFEQLINIYGEVKLRNFLFRNDNDLHFANVSGQWGFSETSFSNGAAIADFDNDGDLDLVINNMNDEAWLFENGTENKNYIQIKFKGPGQNPLGIGARADIFYGKNRQCFQNKTIRGYLSSSLPVAHFGLDSLKTIDSIRVTWKDGKINLLKDVASNQVLVVDYSKAVTNNYRPEKSKQLFKETTKQVLSTNFVHKENDFNDYREQKTLPYEISKSGPFIATGDINNDSQTDFFVGGAKDQAGAIYQQRNGKFVKINVPILIKDKGYEDMGAAFFDVDNDGDQDLYVVSGGAEFNEGNPKNQDRLYINNGAGQFSKKNLPAITSSGSCVAPFDFDGDGDIDVFVGAKVVANKYPFPPTSYLLVNEQGTLVDKTMEVAPKLQKAGMVNSATWADLDGDKKAELIVTGEWMPIKIFAYDGKQLDDVTLQYISSPTAGWWTKVVADDLDGDGDIDLILGNLGENSKYKASTKQPFYVFANDFDRNGTNDIFLAQYFGDKLLPIRGVDILRAQMPILARQFPTYQALAEADIYQLLGNQANSALRYGAQQLSSIIMENQNGKLVEKALPIEAQFSTLNGIIINDFDKDGKKDLLLAGNNFDVEVETIPSDACPGFFLKGKGNLNFEAIWPNESGFFVPYNVKDIQLIKSNNFTTILVSSNNDKLRVFTVE